MGKRLTIIVLIGLLLYFMTRNSWITSFIFALLSSFAYSTYAKCYDE